MDEENEKNAEGEDQKIPGADAGKGNKSKTAKLVDDANTAAERLEKANERKEELLRQEQDLEAKKTLSGRAEAGVKPPAPKKLTDEEYADRVRSGEANPLKEDGFV